MPTLPQELASIGLEPDEAAVYAAALELGSATVLELARKTGLNRTTLYSVVERLIEQRLLVRSVAGKRTVYLAEPPEKLKAMLNDRLSKLDGLLPELLSLARTSVYKPRIRYVEGIDGIKGAYRDSLAAKDKQLVAFVGVERLNVRSKELNAFWDGEYRTGRIKNGIHGRLVVPDNAEGRAFKAKDAESNRQSKLVPAKNYNFEGEILMYDDTVCFVSYADGESFALTLESRAIVRTLRMIWEIVWNVGY